MRIEVENLKRPRKRINFFLTYGRKKIFFSFPRWTIVPAFLFVVFWMFVFADWLNLALQRRHIRELEISLQERERMFKEMKVRIDKLVRSVDELERIHNKLSVALGYAPAKAGGGGLDEKIFSIKQGFEKIYDEFVNGSEIHPMSIPTLRPVKRGYISSEFGPRRDPFTGEYEFHTGIDFSAPAGTPVYATGGGKVVAVGYDKRLGLFVKIKHLKNIYTLYGHLSKVVVKKGQIVQKGQVIGYVGSTGRSTGPHLHYQVSVNGVVVNPRAYLFE